MQSKRIELNWNSFVIFFHYTFTFCAILDKNCSKKLHVKIEKVAKCCNIKFLETAQNIELHIVCVFRKLLQAAIKSYKNLSWWWLHERIVANQAAGLKWTCPIQPTSAESVTVKRKLPLTTALHVLCSQYVSKTVNWNLAANSPIAPVTAARGNGNVSTIRVRSTGPLFRITRISSDANVVWYTRIYVLANKTYVETSNPGRAERCKKIHVRSHQLPFTVRMFSFSRAGPVVYRHIYNEFV